MRDRRLSAADEALVTEVARLLDAPTELGAAEAGSNEEAGSVGAKRTLIIAWNTRWCPDCGSRYFAEDAECCGAVCMPVRLEMHSREPL